MKLLAGQGRIYLDPIYTVLDSHGHNIKLNSSMTSVAFTLKIVLQDFTTSIKSSKSKYDRKLPEIKVITKQTRYYVNRVLKMKNGLECLFVEKIHGDSAFDFEKEGNERFPSSGDNRRMF